MRLAETHGFLLTLTLLTGWSLPAAAATDAAPPKVGDEAFYVLCTSVEGQVPCASALRLAITGREEVGGRPHFWWELTIQTRDGQHYGMRIASERVAMTSPDGVGTVERYIYRDVKGNVVEYRDAATGKALLPPVDFKRSFLPRPAPDAVYDDGFASAGAFLGHVLVRVPPADEPPRMLFDNAIVLDMRTDLLVGASVMQRAEPPKEEGQEAKYRSYTREDTEKMIRAGMNLFSPNAEQLEWIINRPVFFTKSEPTFPNDLYRSNCMPGGLYLDEPMVRLGWSGGIPHNPAGPEQVAEALRQRVAAFYVSDRLRLKTAGHVDMGTLDLLTPRSISWDTDYWSAWYQLAAGAPAIVHEGRYGTRGYGWHPEELFGAEGLDSLTFRDQVNCLNAFLRGAARAFDGDWGVSVYPEGEPELRLPALIQAYEMGARYLWFWVCYPQMSFEVQEELARGVNEYIAKHPRGNLAEVNRAAKVGIAFPSGYVFSWYGTWGMQREQLSGEGASYGDISAAGLWEGIICSRRGIPFDFLIDEPRIRNLGYERLVIVRTDGSMEVSPPWPEPRLAGDLTLTFDQGPLPDVVNRVPEKADYVVKRPGPIVIDGDLRDWQHADWISLRRDTHGFPDVIDAEATVISDLSQERWRLHFHGYMGMEFAEITPELEKKYLLEDFRGKGVVVASVEPGSPAGNAGILEGDVIVGVPRGEINWLFQMYQWRGLADYKDKNPGAKVLFKLRRSGRYHFGSPGDLAADVAFAVNDQNLYVAARVTDDAHSQTHHDWDYWKGDSLQIAFDPTLERRSDGAYGEEDHEVGFILKDGRSFAWRYHGRRGQPLGLMDNVQVQIARDESQTLYEAAIPLTELMPVAPDLWPAIGFDVVVNDSDGGKQRKGRIELRPKAMTQGKRPRDFATMRFEPSPDKDRISAALLWRKRAAEQGGSFRLVVAARSPQIPKAEVLATLQSLDAPASPPVVSRLDLPLSPQAQEHSLSIATQSPPGRYRLTVRVEAPDGTPAAAASLPVYVYPTGPAACQGRRAEGNER